MSEKLFPSWAQCQISFHTRTLPTIEPVSDMNRLLCCSAPQFSRPSLPVTKKVTEKIIFVFNAFPSLQLCCVVLHYLQSQRKSIYELQPRSKKLKTRTGTNECVVLFPRFACVVHITSTGIQIITVCINLRIVIFAAICAA